MHADKNMGLMITLKKPTLESREGVGAGLCDAQIMGAAAIGVTEKEDDEQGIH